MKPTSVSEKRKVGDHMIFNTELHEVEGRRDQRLGERGVKTLSGDGSEKTGQGRGGQKTPDRRANAVGERADERANWSLFCK